MWRHKKKNNKKSREKRSSRYGKDGKKVTSDGL